MARSQAGERRQVRVNTMPWWTGWRSSFGYAIGFSRANDAWFVDEKGYVTEGASANAWILDRDGRLLRAFTTPNDLWRLPITANEIDPRYLELLLAYEDKRFYQHRGVDPLAMMRAAFQLATQAYRAEPGRFLQLTKDFNTRVPTMGLESLLREVFPIESYDGQYRLEPNPDHGRRQVRDHRGCRTAGGRALQRGPPLPYRRDDLYRRGTGHRPLR